MNARMRWRVSLLGLTVAFAGCQGNAKAYRYIETMNAERRALEDRVYALEYDLESMDAELDDALADNEDLRRELGQDKKKPVRRTPERPSSSPDSRREPKIDAELTPPQIDSGAAMEGDESTNPPANLLPKPKDEPKIIPTAATLATNDRQVVRIAIDPARSGGADFDGRRGDDGVTVVIQPKNSAGQIVLDPANVSIAVLDPNRVAEEARVARWDLDAKQVAKLAEDPATNRGLKLHFAWPDQPPSVSLLRLYVRYTTADGEHFDTEQEIHLELPEGARSGRPGWRAER